MATTNYKVTAKRLVGAGQVVEDVRTLDEQTYQSAEFRRARIMFEQMGGEVVVEEVNV